MDRLGERAAAFSCGFNRSMQQSVIFLLWQHAMLSSTAGFGHNRTFKHADIVPVHTGRHLQLARTRPRGIRAVAVVCNLVCRWREHGQATVFGHLAANGFECEYVRFKCEPLHALFFPSRLTGVSSHALTRTVDHPSESTTLISGVRGMESDKHLWRIV
jgi:hypothetical protein